MSRKLITISTKDTFNFSLNKSQCKVQSITTQLQKLTTYYVHLVITLDIYDDLLHDDSLVVTSKISSLYGTLDGQFL